VKARAMFGNGVEAFTRTDLAILLLVLALAGLIGIPTACSFKMKDQKAVCRDNLKQIGLSFRTWALDCGDSYPMAYSVNAKGTRELVGHGTFVHFRALSNEIGRAEILICPADKGKTLATNFDGDFGDKNVSYFVGVDSQDTFPQALLSGDRNVATNGPAWPTGLHNLTTNTPLVWTKAIHVNSGNIALADGSVQFFDSKQLTEAVKNQGLNNRLSIP
jgi:prepilin-type processing-associated H-X9-DG protein